MDDIKSCCGSRQSVEVQPEPQPKITEVEWLLDKDNHANQRMEICRSCDQLIQAVSICKQCGCLMKIKTRIYKAQCPIGRW